MVAVFGTVAADVLHKGLGVPYIALDGVLRDLLAVVFYLWHRSEGTLSIHSIVTQRRETYYWLAVLMTFALGHGGRRSHRRHDASGASARRRSCSPG